MGPTPLGMSGTMADKAEIFRKLKDGLVVSCDLEDNGPFDHPGKVAQFAEAAVSGGAAGIRAEGLQLLEEIVPKMHLPVIGWIKSIFEDNTIRSTGTMADVESLIATGCSILSVDGSFRRREGITGPQFVEQIKKQFDCIVMTDVSTFAEGVACADYGADCISSFLSGFTTDTRHLPQDIPDLNIIVTLVKELTIPVFAHGKISTPKFAKDMIINGAWAVVVGTAITKPKIISNRFSEAIKNARNDEYRETLS